MMTLLRSSMETSSQTSLHWRLDLWVKVFVKTLTQNIIKGCASLIQVKLKRDSHNHSIQWRGHIKLPFHHATHLSFLKDVRKTRFQMGLNNSIHLYISLNFEWPRVNSGRDEMRGRVRADGGWLRTPVLAQVLGEALQVRRATGWVTHSENRSRELLSTITLLCMC